MQFYELNSSRMDYRELSADDLDLLTPLLRSAETMQTLGGALSYEQTLDWLVDTLRRYQTEGCGWLLALDKPTGVPAALCGLTYEQVGAERVLTANCIVRHELRGIGVGRECIAACLLYAFESMHADEVSAFRRMISQDCIPPLPAVCSRPKRSVIPSSARPHRVYGV